MYSIQLKRGGKIIERIWSFSKESYIIEEADYSNLSIYLYDNICLEQGVILRDIFIFLKRDIELFSNVLVCDFLSDFLVEGLSPTENKLSNLYSLRVKWLAHEKMENLKIEPILIGVGDNNNRLLETVNLNDISILPIILNENFQIMKNGNILYSGIKQFKLIDLLKAVVDRLANVVFEEKIKYQKCKQCNKEFSFYFDNLEMCKKCLEQYKNS